MAEPNDPMYMTIDEAAVAGLDYIMPASRFARVEYAIGIFLDAATGLYGFTEPVRGQKASVGHVVSGANHGFVALGHTHPHSPADGYLPHHISNHRETALGVPAYWIAPNGTVHVYEPDVGARRMVRVRRGGLRVQR